MSRSRRTRELGFTGKIWAVHPKRDSLGGIACIRSVAEIDGAPDAAFVAVKREPTIDIVRALRPKGCGGAVIYASGFAETGDAHLQDELLEAADGMPLMGPNCYGFVNGLARAALWPDEHGIEPIDKRRRHHHPVGQHRLQLHHDPPRPAARRRSSPSATRPMSTWRKCWRRSPRDERITAIGLHIEGLKDIAAFARAAEVARDNSQSR